VSALAAWLDRYTARSPAALGERARAHAVAAASETGSATDSEAGSEDEPRAAAEAESMSEVLARGARRALTGVLAHPGDRSAALDLLAGDALITLALLAQAEAAPQELGRFARALLRPERPAP
jgi:hypothetical protein